MGNSILEARTETTLESYDSDTEKYNSSTKSQDCDGHCNGRGYDTSTTGTGHMGNITTHEGSGGGSLGVANAGYSYSHSAQDSYSRETTAHIPDESCGGKDDTNK